MLDVQDGYFDRLLLTPVRRLAILLGHMVADVAVAAALTVPILMLGFVLGVRFETGLLGIVVFIALAALWSLAFSGFGYAIALKTGNPAAVQLELPAVLPVPVPHVVVRAPQSQLTGWLDTVAGLEPGDVPARRAALARDRAAGSGTSSARRCSRSPSSARVSMSLCFAALRGRTRR